MDVSLRRRAGGAGGRAAALVVGFGVCLGACSAKSDSPGPSAGEFARIWSDCSMYCKKQETCGVLSEAACWAGCQPVDLTSQAIVNAGLSSEILKRCQVAYQVADICQAGLSCSEFIGASTPCDEKLMAADANCRVVYSAIDVHASAHPASRLFGAFKGRFVGSQSGDLRCSIYPWATAWAELTNGAGQVVNVAGAVTGSSLVMSGRGKANDGTETITVEGTLVGPVADAAASEFVITGSWRSSDGGSGTFELE